MSLARTIRGQRVVYAVAVTPDSTRIVSACGDDIVVWDTQTGRKVLGPLSGHRGPVYSVAVSSYGRTFASGSYDHTIRIWDAKRGLPLFQPLKGHTRNVYSVAFSADGRILVSGSEDCTIRLWDARTGQPVGEPIKTGHVVNSVAMSSEDDMLAVACDDKTITIYDTTSRTALLKCDSYAKSVYTVAFSPDGRFLASGSGNGIVRNCTVAGRTLDTLLGGCSTVRSIAFSPDGRYIASGSDNNAVRIWDMETGKTHGDPLLGHTNRVNGIAFTPDGRFLVSVSKDTNIKIWDVQSLIPKKQTSSTAKNMTDVVITRNTSIQDIVSHLSEWGCVDMSKKIDWTAANDIPVSQGGFGDIYRCKLKHGAEVAVKTMRIYAGLTEQNQKSLKHAAREIYTWYKCRHPNVQPLRGLVVFRNQLGMVTTWETNGNLPEYLDRHPKAGRIDISIQVAEGLAYLHELGVIHGDLKGANVLVSKNGVARLADFGNATLQEYTLQFTQTSSKESVSLRWAAPELFVGGKCSTQADVYAEILTGKVPWIGKTDLAIMYSVMHKTLPERPMEVMPIDSRKGDMLWALLTSCWEFDAEKRPNAQTVKSQMKDLPSSELRAKRPIKGN
ncbi:Tyrosine kinase family catalytic domain protein [Ceratobasidium sp. AG-Ba]|nr:Tyrosine kinase family catalytic domain protein [Ceratobasidium sp. AG-Ba]